jgi:hypothetical protein
MHDALSGLTGDLYDALDAFAEASRRQEKAKLLRGLQTRLEETLAKAFRKQGKVVLQKLKVYKGRFDVSESISPREWGMVFGEVSDETLRLFSAPILKAVREALELGGGHMYTNLGMAGFKLGVANPSAIRYLDEVGGKRIKGILETVREEVQTVISQAAKGGWSYDRLADTLKGRYEEFAVGKPQEHVESRAHLIAVTEVGDAYEAAGEMSAKDLAADGVAMEKSWATAGDGKVSAGCLENEEQGWIPLEQPHTSGHQRPLRFPGCRCAEQYRRKK